MISVFFADEGDGGGKKLPKFCERPLWMPSQQLPAIQHQSDTIVKEKQVTGEDRNGRSGMEDWRAPEFWNLYNP